MATIELTASALYDGGWRAEDIEEMIEEYDIDRGDAEEICKYLESYAERDRAKEGEA